MKSAEKKLLLLAGAVLVSISALVAGKKMNTWQRSLTVRESSMKQDETETVLMLSTAAEWRARGAWLTQHQPVAGSNLEADLEIFDGMSQRAQQLGLNVVARQHQEPADHGAFRQFGAAFTVKGNLASVFRWIHAAQSPEEFRVVPDLKITPDKDDPAKVECAVQFWRWYQPATAQTL